ncbi:plasmid pRiA4b ORF-3 family protein [Leptolyngbya sp. Cla-17]|uniref:plasmid pRiA4b ORF-3 family protein n=1 Tax=Leptolyngbya sp. Cla-17 TaxID=2803751 RepID=UPI001F5E0E68|nr:plasmid pRiA4b ORF-3 family protein [Leptolyngbya sp. Cla-17]
MNCCCMIHISHRKVEALMQAPERLQIVKQGSSPHKMTQALHLSQTTTNDSVKRHRQTHSELPVIKPTMAPQKKLPSQAIYQLKITPKDIRPPIWRRVQIHSDAK